MTAYRLIMFTTQDYDDWVVDDHEAVAKFNRMLSIVKKAKNKTLKCREVGNNCEYWFEFENEAEAVIFKLTYL